MKKEKIRLVYRKIDELIPYDKNAKLHPQEQIDRLVGSFDEFGRIVPAGIDRDGNLIYEKAAAEKTATHKWALSERELAIIANMGAEAKDEKD